MLYVFLLCVLFLLGNLEGTFTQSFMFVILALSTPEIVPFVTVVSLYMC